MSTIAKCKSDLLPCWACDSPKHLKRCNGATVHNSDSTTPLLILFVCCEKDAAAVFLGLGSKSVHGLKSRIYVHRTDYQFEEKHVKALGC